MMVTQPVTVLGETSSPWFKAHPWLGLTVALTGPLVLGLGIMAILSKTRFGEE